VTPGDGTASEVMAESRIQLDVGDRRRRERSIWRAGLLLSVLAHLVAFAGWRSTVLPPSPFSAAGPRAHDPRAAGGGGGGALRALNLSIPPSRPIIRPPAPLAVNIQVEPVVVPPEPLSDPRSVLGERPEVGPGTGVGTGSGTGAGTGSGSGVGAGSGRGDGGTGTEGLYRLDPPVPRGMIIPPANRSLRGTMVEVWVFVDELGKVVADSTRLNPPTKDRGFNQRLIREAAEWVFRPAMQAGKPVASWFPYQISM
jgi:hypothetical protein